MSKPERPPRWADRFLQWCCPKDNIEETQGDLHEAYYNRIRTRGPFIAKLLFVIEVFQSASLRTVQFPTYSFRNSMTMFKNNIQIFFRKLLRRKSFAAINIIGLTVSLAGALLIFLYVKNELTFDQFNTDAGRIYRVYCAYAYPGESKQEFPYTPPNLAPAIRPEIAGVEQVVRVFDESDVMVNAGGQVFNEKQFFKADSGLFKIFTAEFLAGDAVTALSRPNSIVIPKSTAERYFGSVSSAFGKDVTVNTTDVYNVTAIVDDFPPNSHFRFRGLLSVDYSKENLHPDNWLSHWPQTYILLNKESVPSSIQDDMRLMTERILEPIFKQRYGKSYSEQKAAGGLQEYRLQPLLKVHLHSAHMGDSNDIKNIYLFIAIGVVLITIACFNYINLSTARSAFDARSTGVRKVMGATQAQVYTLFLTESIGTAIIAFILALVTVQGILMADTAFIRQFIPAKNVSLNAIAAFAGLSMLVGVASGLIPSRLLSSFEPVAVLKGLVVRGSGGNKLRQVLVVAQFVGSMALIMCTLLVGRQIDFINSRPLGFNKESLLVVDHVDQLGGNKQVFKNEVRKFSAVAQASLCYGKIGEPSNSAAFTPVEMIEDRKDLVVGIPIYIGDEDYLKTIEAKILMGHPFPPGLPSERQQIILNREAIRQVGWQDRKDDIIGKMIDVNGRRYELAAVVDDYNFTSLKEKIGPMAILSHYWNDYTMLLLRLKPGTSHEAIAQLESTWKKIKPDSPFEYSFVDEDLNRLYAAEQNIAMLFSGFATVAIFVSCLGLLGLAMFVAEKSIKEIGIRKVLGASVHSIVFRLSSNMIKLVAISFVIAIPVAWYVSDQWLNTFAYRVPMNVSPFIMAGLFTFIVAILTMSFQTIKAALTNPAKTLKNE